jgi:hypothetical protein
MMNATLLVEASRPYGPWVAIGAAVLMSSVGVALWICAPTMRERALRGRPQSPRWVSKLTPAPASVGTIRLGAVMCLLMGIFCFVVAIIGD